jgi:hypothetical protein
MLSSYKSAVPKSLLKTEPIDWSSKPKKDRATKSIARTHGQYEKNTAKQASGSLVLIAIKIYRLFR